MSLARLVVAVADTGSDDGGFDWTAFGTIVALAGLILSNVLTWRGQRQDKKLAQASAQRAENAAALSVDASGRVVEALERIASATLTTAPVRGVRWSLTYDTGSRYIVTNTGDATALDVHVNSAESLQLINAPDGIDLAPGEAAAFIAAPSLATDDYTINVDWANDDGTSGEWRYPLPGKPKADSR